MNYEYYSYKKNLQNSLDRQREYQEFLKTVNLSKEKKKLSNYQCEGYFIEKVGLIPD